MPAPLAMEDAIARVEAYARLGSATAAARALGWKRVQRMHHWLWAHGYAKRVYDQHDWTMSQIATLKRLAPQGVGAKEIAAAVGRSVSSVRSFASAHKIRIGPKHRWTPGERRGIDKLVDNAVGAIVRELGVDEGAALSALVAGCIRRRKRAKASQIADLGGMAQLGHVTPKGRAA